MYLRLKSRMGYQITEDEARSVMITLNSGKPYFLLRGNLISSSELAGIFTDKIGKDYEARDRGLVKHGDDYRTPKELLGYNVILHDLGGDEEGGLLSAPTEG